MNDLFLGAVGERLQSMQWLRFVSIAGLMATVLHVAISTVVIIQYRPAADFLQSPVFLLSMAISWYVLPLALITRLNRTPSWTELFPILGLLTSFFIWAVGNGGVNQAVGKVAAFVFFSGMAGYGFSNLKVSNFWLRILKLSFAGFWLVSMLVQVTTAFFAPLFNQSLFIISSISSSVFLVGIVFGLIFPVAQPRATTAAHT